MKLKNFAHVRDVPADLWSNMIIDGHPFVAEYISEDADHDIIVKLPKWKTIHLCPSQYFLQIVKYADRTFPKPFQSSY